MVGLGMIHIWRPWKLSSFQDPSPPLSIYVQNLCTPLNLDIQFQTTPTQFQMKASLSALSWLYTLVCAVVQKYHEISFLLIIIHILPLILQSPCFICTTWKRKQTMEKQPHCTYEQMKSKQKWNQVTLHSNWPPLLLFDLAHKQSNGIIKGWLRCLMSESKGKFLVNNILINLAQDDAWSWHKSCKKI